MKLAREKKAQHFVYRSVGSANRNTGIPHCENKFRVELTVRQLGFPSHIILRPVYFVEDLTSALVLNGERKSCSPSKGFAPVVVDFCAP